MASLYPAGPLLSGYNGVTHGFYSGPYFNIKAEQIMCKDCYEYILTFMACFGHQMCFCWRRLAGPHCLLRNYPFARERTYVSRYLCSPVPMFPEPVFPGAYVPRYLCSPVPMFPGFCTLIVVISINRLQILPTPWYDSRLGLCLGFRFRVLVKVRIRVRVSLFRVRVRVQFFGYG